MRRQFISALVLAGLMSSANSAWAQYKSFTFGFDLGYINLDPETDVRDHNVAVGAFGGYKIEDNWWLYSRADISLSKHTNPSLNNTVVLLHIEPVSVRYYLFTDRYRPWIGLSSVFNHFANRTDGKLPTWWGPAISAGFDFKLSRDLFLGLEAQEYYLINFDGPDAFGFRGGVQLIFFM